MSGLSQAQKVSKLIVQINQWEAAGRIDKQQGQQLNALTMAHDANVLALADEIGQTADNDLLQKAVTLASSDASSSASSAPEAAAAASSSSGSSSGSGLRSKGRPALNIGAVKETNATPEAALADEEESQADALLKAKRMRNLKRQSMPEKTSLPAEVQSQLPQQ